MSSTGLAARLREGGKRCRSSSHTSQIRAIATEMGKKSNLSVTPRSRWSLPRPARPVFRTFTVYLVQYVRVRVLYCTVLDSYSYSYFDGDTASRGTGLLLSGDVMVPLQYFSPSFHTCRSWRPANLHAYPFEIHRLRLYQLNSDSGVCGSEPRRVRTKAISAIDSPV